MNFIFNKSEYFLILNLFLILKEHLNYYLKLNKLIIEFLKTYLICLITFNITFLLSISKNNK
jgi:hypothetical protein